MATRFRRLDLVSVELRPRILDSVSFHLGVAPCRPASNAISASFAPAPTYSVKHCKVRHTNSLTIMVALYVQGQPSAHSARFLPAQAESGMKSNISEMSKQSLGLTADG